MAEHLLKFVNLPKAMPDKREASLRREDFQEIYERFRPAAASAQASRCSQCGVPFCQIHCPLHNNIPDWLKLTAEGRLSAWVLTGMPVAVAGFMFVSRREYLRPLYTRPLGLAMLGGALLLVGVGVLWMRNLVKVEV